MRAANLESSPGKGAMQQHWDQFYTATPVDRTGFWEPTPEMSVGLVERAGLAPNDLILDAGGGASTFVDSLLDRGHANVAVADISSVALGRVQERLGVRGPLVRWLQADLSDPTSLREVTDVALWHDRAVLHFLTDEAEREAYSAIVNRVVRPGGFVVLAAFSLTGAPECTGLPVRNYDAAMFGEVLGDAFTLVEAFDHVYINPAGNPRPYVYTLFRRANSLGG